LAKNVALTEQVERLAEDHENAAYLAQQLNQLDGFDIDLASVQTNMVFATLASHVDEQALVKRCRGEGILISPGRTLRFVTHKDVSRQDIDKVLQVFKLHLQA